MRGHRLAECFFPFDGPDKLLRRKIDFYTIRSRKIIYRKAEYFDLALKAQSMRVIRVLMFNYVYVKIMYMFKNYRRNAVYYGENYTN